MLNVVVSAVSELAPAVIVIGPASAPVTVLLATPPAAVALPRPLTVPVPLVFVKLTEVVLSLLSRLPAASRTSTVSVRPAPAARLVVELVKVRWSAAPATIVKVVVPEPSEPAPAVIVIGPASAPVTVLVAIPADAVAVPSPPTLPVPLVFVKLTEVVLSLLSRLPAASRTSTVSVRVLPEARSPVELVKVRWSAAPGTIVKVVVPEPSEPAPAVIVIGPASAPVTVLVATPPVAGVLPRPPTVPAPLVLVKLTEVVLSPVSRLPAASRISTVSVRPAPAARSAVELVKVRWSAAPATTLNVVVSALSELAPAVIVIGPASAPVTVLLATPADAVAVASPVTVPVPLVFVKLTEVVLSLISRLPAASRTSTVSVRVFPAARLAVELVKVR